MITWHQITDLPLHINLLTVEYVCGNLIAKSYSMLLKKDVPDCGNSYNKTLMRSYSASEKIKQ